MERPELHHINPISCRHKVGKREGLAVLAEGANILRLLKHAKASEQEKGGEGDVVLKYGYRKCISR